MSIRFLWWTRRTWWRRHERHLSRWGRAVVFVRKSSLVRVGFQSIGLVVGKLGATGWFAQQCQNMIIREYNRDPWDKLVANQNEVLCVSAKHHGIPIVINSVPLCLREICSCSPE